MEQWEEPLQGCSRDILEEDDPANDMKPTQVAMMKEEVPQSRHGCWFLNSLLTSAAKSMVP